MTIPAVPVSPSSLSDEDSSYSPQGPASSERQSRGHQQEVVEEVEVSPMTDDVPSSRVRRENACCITSFAFEDDVMVETTSESIRNVQVDNNSRSSFKRRLDGTFPSDEQYDSDDASQSSAYFDLMDFQPSTWLQVVYDNMDYAPTLVLVATTAVIVHPLLFLAGAATAVWAVGSVHAIQHGYDFFTDGSFSRLFWKDPVEADSYDERLALAREEAKRLDEESGEVDGDSNVKAATTETTMCKIDYEEQKDVAAAPSSLLNTEWVNLHFPLLEVEIVRNVEFPGLNGLEFFKVFFANDAPYSFLEFQRQRGDVDIIYGTWKDVSEAKLSMHPQAVQRSNNLPDDLMPCQERLLTFKTLTKSYFGPAYASATKRQRVFRSKRLMVLESQTHLSNIPFCDRFQVMDRWVLVSHKSDEILERKVSMLSVHSEVQFRRSCPFESQIRTKSSATLRDVVNCWSEMATQALKLAEQNKRERERQQEQSYIEKHKSVPTRTEKEEILLAQHEQNFYEMEQELANCSDLESIEVEHSYAADGSLCFAPMVGNLDAISVVDVARRSNQQQSPMRVRSLSNIRRSVIQLMRRKSSIQ